MTGTSRSHEIARTKKSSEVKNLFLSLSCRRPNNTIYPDCEQKEKAGDGIVRQTGYKRREEERDISAMAVKREGKKKSRRGWESKETENLCNRVIHRAAKRQEKGEPKEEEQRLVPRSNAMAYFLRSLFRDAIIATKHEVFYLVGFSLLRVVFFFSHISPLLLSLKIKFSYVDDVCR